MNNKQPDRLLPDVFTIEGRIIDLTGLEPWQVFSMVTRWMYEKGFETEIAFWRTAKEREGHSSADKQVYRREQGKD